MPAHAAMMATVVGIDVGGPRKGFHAVAFRGGTLLGKTGSADAGAIARWCVERDAVVIAVDAPCRWRTGTKARLAERAMAAVKISSFSTPTEERARGHSFFTWMVAGAELYAALSAQYPLYTGGTAPRASIETFPQAVACALAGEIVSAKIKVNVRRELLRLAGLAPTDFANIDEIDAALCALAAEAFVRGEFVSYGDVEGGFIIVPSKAVAGFEATKAGPTVAPREDGGKSGATVSLNQILDALPSLTMAERVELRSTLERLTENPIL